MIAEQLGPPRNHDLGWLSGNQQHGIAKNQVLEFFVWGARVRVCASGNLFASECVRFLDLVRRQGHFDRGKRIMVAFSLLMHALEQGGFVQSVYFASQMQGIPAGSLRRRCCHSSSNSNANWSRSSAIPVVKLTQFWMRLLASPNHATCGDHIDQ